MLTWFCVSMQGRGSAILPTAGVQLHSWKRSGVVRVLHSVHSYTGSCRVLLC